MNVNETFRELAVVELEKIWDCAPQTVKNACKRNKFSAIEVYRNGKKVDGYLVPDGELAAVKQEIIDNRKKHAGHGNFNNFPPERSENVDEMFNEPLNEHSEHTSIKPYNVNSIENFLERLSEKFTQQNETFIERLGNSYNKHNDEILEKEKKILELESELREVKKENTELKDYITKIHNSWLGIFFK